jgi:N-acetylneuraminic acid mutarotase
MQKVRAGFLFLGAILGTLMAWAQVPDLPKPVSNNAVAGMGDENHFRLFSFMGIGPAKTFDAITRDAWMFDSRAGSWAALPPVPGSSGRIAASAIALGGRVYVLGGYHVAADGKETSSNDVDIFTPPQRPDEKGYWMKGAPIPVFIDDAVIGTYEGVYVVVVSGWSNDDAVADVEVYNTMRNHWRKSTKIPGTPVFGHSGGIAGKQIIYCGGAFRNGGWVSGNADAPKYVESNNCWRGDISSWNGATIKWKKIPTLPGKARYRQAAGAAKDRVIFVGGTDNPYNYNGVGYDGRPSAPVSDVVYWDTHKNAWAQGTPDTHPTMDHRGLVIIGKKMFVIGGMEEGQKVTAKVKELKVP